MRPLGFSTGALAYGDFRQALRLLRNSGTDAVELSALHMSELGPLVVALPYLDLCAFRHVSVHAPIDATAETERGVVEALGAFAACGWPIVVHPDALIDLDLWRPFGDLLLLENLDTRKPIARTCAEMCSWFAEFPEARLCLDLAHAREVDPTLTEARRMLRGFGDLLAEVHISELDGRRKHVPMSLNAEADYRTLMSDLPEHVPVIVEAVTQDVAGEVAAVRRALP